MRIDFPYYQGIPPLEVPYRNLIGIYEPPCVEATAPETALIHRAFDNPIGRPPIRRAASDARNALVITDDYTRNTPVRPILDRLMAELEAAGVPADRTTILVALGTHRTMTDSEMETRFGEEIVRRYRIVNHEWRNEDQLVALGATETGIPIRVNRLVEDVDFIFGIGQIVPHRVAGFSGGGKIIQPGICGAETTAETHWRSALYPGGEILGVADNPIRQGIEQVAAHVGLSAIANAVCDADGRLIDLFVGDPVAAHRAGARLSSRIYGFELPEPADVLLIDSYPMDIELWQAAKALYAGELALKKDGVAILVSPCPEGVSRTHGLILSEGYRPSQETISLVESGRIPDKIVASHLVRVGRVIRDNGSAGILVSPGISAEHKERLGFLHASTPHEALGLALDIKGRDASVMVIRRGGTSLPLLPDKP
ncbi:MAG: nickel-dependent lactate racemase [Armatimonadetes bacterium]|nr:nickel-dependent lactate racemase [Armatimonadota bacterium]